MYLAASAPDADGSKAPGDAPAQLSLDTLPALPHPLGSGLNTPQPLGYQPARGRLFGSLMKQLVAAARSGDLERAQQLQQRLWSITRKGPGHRRSLLQAANVNACPALANSVPYATQAAWAAAGGNPAAGAGSPSVTPPQGPLPSIRFFTLEPCAEWGCRASYTLVRQADGTIRCRGPANTPPPLRPPGVAPPVPTVPTLDFAYFKVYDYDLFWNTDDDNVLAGAAYSNKLTNINQLTSSRGALGLSSGLQNTANVRLQPNPLLGLRADSDASATLNAGLQVSRAVGDNGVFGIKTALPGLAASGSFGAVLPGTSVAERDSGNSDDNVVFGTNQPALYGFFGRKRS